MREKRNNALLVLGKLFAIRVQARKPVAARAEAVLACATFYLFMLLVVLGYYFAAGQLWPILPW